MSREIVRKLNKIKENILNDLANTIIMNEKRKAARENIKKSPKAV